jgi:hypothetical protein
MWLDYGARVEDYAAICADTDCGVYPCLNPFAAEWVSHRAVNSYTPNPVNFNRRVFFSDEQFRGCLRNYDSRGADGVYTFNLCCEKIDNPEYVRRAHAVATESPQDRRAQRASWFYLPIWRKELSPSGAPQSWRTLRFALGEHVVLPFRLDLDRVASQLTGRLRFRVYNLHDQDELTIDLNGSALTDEAVVERRKTNIHVAADRRYPGMHITPHIAYEIDLQRCPPLSGENELGLLLTRRDPAIDSDCMVEALEIDVGWDGSPQIIGYPARISTQPARP